MPFMIENSALPSWHPTPTRHSVAKLGMSSPSHSSAPKMTTGNFISGGTDYGIFVRSDRPWMHPIPGYVDKNGYQFVFRNCCDYIDPTTSGSSFYYSTPSDNAYFTNNGFGKLTSRNQSTTLRSNTQNLMLAITGGGGGGSGSSGTASGSGGGGGATAIVVVDLTKVSAIQFQVGSGGAGGSKGTSSTVNRHGSAGVGSYINLTLKNNWSLKLSVEGGSAGLQYSSSNGGTTSGGAGGSKVTIQNYQGSTSGTFTASNLSGVNYIAINQEGRQITYPDTNREGVIYILSITPGGTGGAGGMTTNNYTSPITPTATTYCTGVTYTPPAQIDHSRNMGATFAGSYGGDGGYSVYGKGGTGSYSYYPTVDSIMPVWTNAGASTGYGSGGAGDVFLAGFGKNGTAGSAGVIHILSYNSTTSTPNDVEEPGVVSRLKTPVITDAVISDEGGAVEMTIRNDNSVDVNVYISIHDNTGVELYSGYESLAANTSEWFGISINSSHVRPLELVVHFEAEGYEDSGETGGALE